MGIKLIVLAWSLFLIVIWNFLYDEDIYCGTWFFGLFIGAWGYVITDIILWLIKHVKII